MANLERQINKWELKCWKTSSVNKRTQTAKLTKNNSKLSNGGSIPSYSTSF
jgi:hypothetical protein